MSGSGISVNDLAHKSATHNIILLYFLKFIFVNRGGGSTTTHLYNTFTTRFLWPKRPRVRSTQL